MRGYVTMWRANFTAAIVLLLFGVGFVLYFHYRVEHRVPNRCASRGFLTACRSHHR